MSVTSAETPGNAAAGATPAAVAPPKEADRIEALVAQYLQIDRRLLGVVRIYFGLVLLVDLLRRFPDLTLFYTNSGVLPNHYALFAPMSQPIFSLFFACSTKAEVGLAFTMTALVYACLTVGYRTRLMQVLTAILYPSLISRNLFFEMGGSCCLTLVASWTLFLPMGDRYSVDAIRASLARRREEKASELDHREDLRPNLAPHTSLVVLGLLLQITAIYFFNGVQKHGEGWSTGQAVHYVLWQNRIATPLCGWLRLHEPSWFSPFLTWGTLVVEEISPFMLLAPFVWRWTRSAYFVLAVSLHTGIALFSDVGPYSYVMYAFDLLFLPGFWLDRVEARLRKNKTRVTLAYDAGDAGLHFLARVVARLDTFELVRFVDRRSPSCEVELPGLPPGPVAARRADGSFAVGPDGVLAALVATPFGELLALPPVPSLVALAVTRRATLAGVLGLRPGLLETDARTRPLLDPDRVPGLPRARLVFREASAALFTFICVMQIFHDNFWLDGKIPERWRRGPPGVLAEVPLYLRQIQGWMMFREPPLGDLTVIVDGETIDGRHIDPFTGKPPDFDVAFHGPLRYGQLFCDYFISIVHINNAHYRVHLGNYLQHWQELEGRPEADRLRSYRVLSIENDSPPFGSTRPTNVRQVVLLEGP